MNKLALASLAGLLALSGCTRPYVMKLHNGLQITTRGKPKLKDGSYHYKDGHGHDASVPQGRVLEVEPASMAEEEKKQFAPPPPPKARHWYLLWLG